MALPLIWLGRALTRRRLRELDARALDDVGIDPAARARECALRPWQGSPLDR